MRTSFRRAFTLVELLVVIGIIALLMSMLLPVMKKARISAYRVHCMSNLRQIATACYNYASENKDHFPPRHYNTAPYSLTRAHAGTEEDFRTGIGLLIGSYMKTGLVAYCPWQRMGIDYHNYTYGWGQNWPYTTSSPAAGNGIVGGYTYIGPRDLRILATNERVFVQAPEWFYARRKTVFKEPLVYDHFFFDRLGKTLDHGGGYNLVLGDGSAKYVPRTRELAVMLEVPGVPSSEYVPYYMPILDYCKRY